MFHIRQLFFYTIKLSKKDTTYAKTDKKIAISDVSEAAGCETDVVKCLRGLPVEDLLAVTQQFPRWKPVLDGALGASLAVMPVDQLTALLTGQYKAHNLLPIISLPIFLVSK
jgi:hypothetical protein